MNRITVVKRGFLGLLIGLNSTYIIPLVISLIINDGDFHSVSPLMIERYGSELTAVTIQTVLSGLLGIVMGIGSLIWNENSFEITRNTIKHFLLLSVTLLPVAWICYWMQHTIKTFIFYTIQFVIIYIIIWLIGMVINFRKIKKVNRVINTLDKPN